MRILIISNATNINKKLSHFFGINLNFFVHLIFFLFVLNDVYKHKRRDKSSALMCMSKFSTDGAVYHARNIYKIRKIQKLLQNSKIITQAKMQNIFSKKNSFNCLITIFSLFKCLILTPSTCLMHTSKNIHLSVCVRVRGRIHVNND